MFNPFLLGADFMRLGTQSWQLALKMAETASASGIVVNKRLGMMAAAGSTPSSGDLKEMNRMVAEKADAFSKAALSLAAGGGGISPAAMMAAYSTALTPIHRAATANARRLTRKPKRKAR